MGNKKLLKPRLSKEVKQLLDASRNKNKGAPEILAETIQHSLNALREIHNERTERGRVSADKTRSIASMSKTIHNLMAAMGVLDVRDPDDEDLMGGFGDGEIDD